MNDWKQPEGQTTEKQWASTSKMNKVNTDKVKDTQEANTEITKYFKKLPEVTLLLYILRLL